MQQIWGADEEPPAARPASCRVPDATFRYDVFLGLQLSTEEIGKASVDTQEKEKKGLFGPASPMSCLTQALVRYGCSSAWGGEGNAGLWELSI